ncbi:DUF397 domain-containing protein [Streptomyces sp. BR1]|uniref:DUF397 domain-containing protein n=1 Tax=Streptomyces sp. BR1 TaxID=1592323 RepID=UPI00402BBFF6
MSSHDWQKSSYCGQGESCLHVTSTWQKSSHCQEGDACVHVTYAWQKSSRCQEGEACVHVTAGTGTILLTESSDPAEVVLTTTPAAFAELIYALKQNTAPGPGIEVVFGPEEQVRLYETAAPETVVTTTREKWDAFVLGGRAGEFDRYGEFTEVGCASSAG